MKGTKKKTIVVAEKGYVKTILFDKYGNQFIGEAKCAGNDIFNEEFGSKLSYLRAKRLMGVTMKNALGDEINELAKAIVDYSIDYEDYSDVADEAKEQIVELYKETFGE
jgi:hypothetical protein